MVHATEKEFVSMKCICPILNRPTGVDKTDFHQEAWSLVRCQETGLVFLADPPDYSQLESEFAWEETSTADFRGTFHITFVFTHQKGEIDRLPQTK